jgi:adenine-specific DNA-methyltransferase
MLLWSNHDQRTKILQVTAGYFHRSQDRRSSGFVNLMRIKSNYSSNKDDIDKALKQYPTFREELFDKLFTFFSRYFTKSGLIYFNSTPFHNNI